MSSSAVPPAVVYSFLMGNIPCQKNFVFQVRGRRASALRPGRGESYGFKLVELVIGCMLFATVTVGFAGMWSYNARSFYHANTQLLANNLAQEMLEQARAARFEGIWTLKEQVDDEPDITFVARRNGHESVTRLSRTLEVVDNSPRPGVRRATAVVQWNHGVQNHQIRLVTYLVSTM